MILKKNNGDDTMQSHKQEAFTLVEIMIVIAIIGILSMIAIPAYKDFTVRSKISEGLSLAAGAKTSVIEYYQTQGNWPISNANAGLPSADHIKGEFVKSVAIEGNKVVVTFGSGAGEGLSQRNLIMTAVDNSGSISWTCHADKIENRFLPPNCREGKI
jgi:type IV pilus assembly protein PilA